MSEYANSRDRGRLVGLVFSTQALGLIVGPLIALGLLGAGTSTDLTWRLLLGLGAVPAAAVIYLRRTMPESPRFQAQVLGQHDEAGKQMHELTSGALGGNGIAAAPAPQRMALRAFLTHRRLLLTLAGTAGCWFLLDYAYYGNTISTPQIIWAHLADGIDDDERSPSSWASSSSRPCRATSSASRGSTGSVTVSCSSGAS